jgi:transcription-repair coupling factor (superfamily II helicase)
LTTSATPALADFPQELEGLLDQTAINLPKAGALLSLPALFGASDSMLLARLGVRAKQEKRLLALVTANAQDSQRLAEEIKFFAPQLEILVLPDWETLPYETFSPHQDLISERLATLYQLSRGQCDVLLVSLTTALHRFTPCGYLSGHTFYFKRKQTLDEAALRTQLVSAGYEHVSQVVKPGEYCVRGGLIDLFPMGSKLPFRLDLFDNELESIKTFDPDSQRTLYPVDEVRLLPGREFPLDEASRLEFRNRWRERFEGDPSKALVYKDIGSGIASAGIEYYLGLFFPKLDTLFDYFPPNTLLALHGPAEEAGRQFGLDVASRHRFAANDSERPLLKPEEIYLSIEQWFVAAQALGRINVKAGEVFTQSLPALGVDRRSTDPIAYLRAYVNAPAQAQQRRLIVAETDGRRETLSQYLSENGLHLPAAESWQEFLASDEPTMLASAPLFQGFGLLKANLALITEAELFASVARRGRKGRAQETNVDAIIRDLSELKIGDPVVHQQHGIGRYQGLISLDLGDGANEFLHLTYANGATLYVPVASLHLIGRYSGASPDDAPLHTLGSGNWDKAKRKAAQQARDTAAELLNLYARRAAREGHAFQFNAADYESFASTFGFEETPDQLAAIHATVQDMIATKPMDRLVCGDVGFGKTEVALRAAFIAVTDGKQVAVLCPTTLLAEQHFQTFSDRFADWPVKLAELSRFRNAKETKVALEGIADGTVDIVIGTHKLLSKETQFSRLGLVVIDEEHRFGVRQKETLKAMRAEVDVLTLTATPIPRTLAMSMEGLRDFSIIATAPQKRLSIKTFVRRENDGAIREALLREIKRGGQCYFLHNEVETIENRRQMLEKLVPEARVLVAHGQMNERELERVMRDFTQQRANVLLCTTIIETGIDNPMANTIVMHRADKFGLAQLHQLRGRVGRSHHQAYAYLLVPDEQGITSDAKKRLDAIQQMEDLGSGFFLAMHDLEIRGSGAVLGDEQSGSVSEIGFQMYADMISLAVKDLKAGREPDLASPMAVVTEINLHTPALMPNDFCPDVHERLTIYKRLANCKELDAVIFMQEELIDRFGKLPEQTKALIEVHRLRIQSELFGIAKIDASSNAIAISFKTNPLVDPMSIIQYIQAHRDAKLAGQDKLRITLNDADLATRIQRIRGFINALRPLKG